MNLETWIKSMIGLSLAIAMTWLGIATNLFTPEIRCCLGIDVCPPPSCIQKAKCFLGISIEQCFSQPLPSQQSPPIPVTQHKSEYEKCQTQIKQALCHGILAFSGQCYSGELRYQYRGRGILSVHHGDECYEGLFQNGKFHGEGRLFYRDNTIYQGKFIEGKRQGQGKMIDSNGLTVYEGNWFEDKPRTTP